MILKCKDQNGVFAKKKKKKRKKRKKEKEKKKKERVQNSTLFVYLTVSSYLLPLLSKLSTLNTLT